MHQPRSLRRFPAMAVLLCVSGLTSPALAKVRTGVDVSLGGKVSTNPFNLDRQSGAVVAISPAIAPWLTYEDPGTNVLVQGDLLVDQYTRAYGRNVSGSAKVDIQQAVSPNFSLRAGGNYFDSTVGLTEALLVRSTGIDIVPPAGTLLPDVSTIGQRSRIQSLTGRLGGDLKLSTKDTFSFNGTATLARNNASDRADFLNKTGSFSYSRKLSPRTTVLVSADISNADYFNTSEGDGTIISPHVGITRQLGLRLNIDLSIGASFANFERESGRKEKFSILSGSMRLCNTINLGMVCLNAARIAQPTALGGISTASDVTLGVDRAVGRSNMVGITARYSRVEQSYDRAGLKQDFLGVNMNFSRKFSNRFFIFVAPSYSKSFDDVASREANFEVRGGLRYRFGAI